MAWDIWQEQLRIDDSMPLYKQLEGIILTHIKSNALKPGETIPSEADFCTHFHLSRTTVRQAFKNLEEKGLIIRRRGLGSFVAEPKVNRNLDSLYSFSRQLSEMGYTPSSKLLRFEEILLDADSAQRLGLAADVPVYSFTRLRLANAKPMLLESTILVKRFLPTLSTEKVEQGSLYQMLKEQGLQMRHAVESYEPVVMDKKTQRRLQSLGNPCAFSIQRRSYTQHGELFEYTRSIMPGQRSRLEITLREGKISLSRYEEKD